MSATCADRTPDCLAGLLAEEVAVTLSALSTAATLTASGRRAGAVVELALTAAERADTALAFAEIVDGPRRHGWSSWRRLLADAADQVMDAVG